MLPNVYRPAADRGVSLPALLEDDAARATVGQCLRVQDEILRLLFGHFRRVRDGFGQLGGLDNVAAPPFLCVRWCSCWSYNKRCSCPLRRGRRLALSLILFVHTHTPFTVLALFESVPYKPHSLSGTPLRQRALYRTHTFFKHAL